MSDRGMQEAREFLERNPDINSIDLMIGDINGVIRGKRIPRDSLLKAYEEGVCLPASLFALDINGNTIEETGLGLDQGEGDRLCFPVPGTLSRVPWQDRPCAQVLMSMYENDGSPFVYDPRHVLQRVLDRFATLGLTPVVAVETEFYVIDRERDRDHQLQPPLSPVSGKRDRQCQVYSLSDLDDYCDFLESIQHAALIQNLPVDTAIAECAPGQFEINLKHRPDAMQACDEAVLLKRLIKGVAARHSMEATFMAKPYNQEAGSGTHIHVSLVDSEGNNRCCGDDDHPLGSELLQQAVAGVLALMPESMVVFAPNANSYRRFQPGFYVPMSQTWGADNRTVAVRIPGGNPAARRLEHRVAGADVNPYLLVASILAGIHYGLTHRLSAPEPVTGNAYASHPPSLPNSWIQALDQWQRNEILPEYLGQEFCRVYHANRYGERQLFMRHVSSQEYDWYLRSV
ncbi:glutamate--putrescine ligase [Oceanimonas sp. GK1]|uniref:glutamine synthetase family protein n=1 Tax=Oceanimonas sp. (strain GK1 / IBRC-M 10197) TaxID=511062 RepID=UPI0002494AE1|nr:glutamine synthetase family protein [Oceanimonas sp. GK1]AEX99792.1 glutamate--putrescine ligase [Oceanimonas sp. GK1]